MTTEWNRTELQPLSDGGDNQDYDNGPRGPLSPSSRKRRRWIPIATVFGVGILSTVAVFVAMENSSTLSSIALASPNGQGAQTPPATSSRTQKAPAAAAPQQVTPPPASAVADATRVSEAFATVAERVSPAVVSIRIEARRERPNMPQGFFGFPFGNPFGNNDSGVQRGAGSGVIFRSDGAILTNNHVVQNATRIEVQLQDGRRFRAEVVGTDPATDLAVIRIPARGLPVAPFADSARARVGEWVVAIGSPFGLDYTVTAGVLSAIGRGGIGASEIEDYLQTDASINPGNSGGPLVNLRGEVLGINTMIVGRGTGIGFAVPSTIASRVAQDLITSGSVRRAWIGVGFQELTPELSSSLGVQSRRGALVSEVVPSGPAARAGLQPGDVIVQVDGVNVQESRDLLRAVLQKQVGSRVALSVLRKGRPLSVQVTTQERPGDVAQNSRGRSGTGPTSEAPRGKFGLQLQALDPSIAQQLGMRANEGVLVAGVAPGSIADRSGLEAGDVIVEADQRPVRSVQQVTSALADNAALLRIKRRAGMFFVALRAE